MIEVVPSRPTHVGPIASRIRSIDAEECLAAGMTVKEALRHGLAVSETCWTVTVDGKPEAMFGVVATNVIEGRGRIWLLMTDDAMAHHRAIVRLGRVYTEALQRHYAILENVVHADNGKAIRWLSRMGFHVGVVDVIRGRPMRYFVRMG